VTCSPAGAGGAIFHTQVRASGSIPQGLPLFRPVGGRRGTSPRSAISWAMVDGTPRCTWAARGWSRWMVKEKTTLERWARPEHCTRVRVRHYLAASEHDALAAVAATCPTCVELAAAAGRRDSGEQCHRTWPGCARQRAAGFRHGVVRGLVDEGLSLRFTRYGP